MSDEKKQKTVNEISDAIRTFVNNSTIKKTTIYSKRKTGYWDQFCVALDTLADTSLAINSFLDSTSNSFILNPYLETYGVLQALFMQQDAVNYLKISLFGEDNRINWKVQYPDLYSIRQLRNETVGHPVKTENKIGVSSCTIDRSSLSKDGFNYILWTSAKATSKTISYAKIITLQNKSLATELESIYTKLKNEEETHKQKFNGEKLTNELNQKSLYEINLIYGVIWNDILAWPSFDHYLAIYKRIKVGLEKRYGKFGESLRISGTAELIKKLDHIFLKIESFKKIDQLDKLEFEIYVDALESNINELQDHLREVDNEFKI